MGQRRVYACLNSATNATISYKILVKNGPVVSAENRLTNGNCTVLGSRLQFDDRRPFVMLAFENELEYWNSDFSAFIVRFASVTPEFKT